MENYAIILTAMANAKRLEILDRLIEGELPVTQLAGEVGLSQSALSQHLAKLRAAKLVSTRREAQTIYYSTKSPAVKAIMAALGETMGGSESVVPIVGKSRKTG